MNTTHDRRTPLPAYQPRHRAERQATQWPVRKLLAGSVTGLVLTGGLAALAPAAPAMALDSADGPDNRSANKVGSAFSKSDLDQLVPTAARAVGIAASQAGTPYVYGGTTPAGFDCSGFTQWVYARMGKSLPRTSSAQAGAVTRISAAAARPGDLVFFTGGGGVYHVGIYAGGGSIWHSPRPGEGVRREAIWTSSVFYGRLGG